MADRDALWELDAPVASFRPQDAAAIAEMQRRAREAEQRGDSRWLAQTPATTVVEELAVWVAEGRRTGRVVGMVALRPAAASAEAPANEPLANAWRARTDVLELRRLRVAPDHRRQGVATALTAAALAWAHANGTKEVVLNTTAAQRSALELYRKLGFREVFRSFVGQYELVWMSRRISL